MRSAPRHENFVKNFERHNRGRKFVCDNILLVQRHEDPTQEGVTAFPLLFEHSRQFDVKEALTRMKARCPVQQFDGS